MSRGHCCWRRIESRREGDQVTSGEEGSRWPGFPVGRWKEGTSREAGRPRRKAELRDMERGWNVESVLLSPQRAIFLPCVGRVGCWVLSEKSSKC